jgi:hypothetical protein
MSYGASVTAKLTRGDGPRQWQSYSSSDRGELAVFYRCPFCGYLNSLGTTAITADGLVARLVTCPQSLCLMTFQLLLLGWRFDQVAHHGPFAGALAQADGCGQ